MSSPSWEEPKLEPQRRHDVEELVEPHPGLARLHGSHQPRGAASQVGELLLREAQDLPALADLLSDGLRVSGAHVFS